MAKLLEVHANTSRKKDNGYPHTQRIGTAFVNDNGSIDISFDFVPPPSLNKDGLPTYRLKLWEPKERDQNTTQASYQRGGGGDYQPDSRGAPASQFDDDIPFCRADEVL